MMEEMITLRGEDMTRFIALFDRIENGLEKFASRCRPTFNGERYITDKELCKRLKVSDRTTQDWRTTGKIAYVQFGEKGKVMYAESEVERLITAHYQEAWMDDY
ncbi:MAG: helix-turn-helix domain-containing protein [Rikenellaceae bacterium]